MAHPTRHDHDPSPGTLSEDDLLRVVDDHVAAVAATLSPEEMGRAMGDVLMATIPEFEDSDDEDFRAGLVMSCTSNLVAIQEALVERAPTEAFTPPADAIAWAHELVHRGMSLAALLRAYRLGHGFFERGFEEAASRVELDPELRWRVLARAGRSVFTYIDAVSTRLVQDYEEEREHWLRGAAAAQAEIVHAIIAGEPVDVPEASASLRHDLEATHLGFIVWNDLRVRPRDESASLAATARSLAAELGGGATLLLPIGDRIVWGWTTVDGPAPIPARSALLGRHTGAAVGTAHVGPQGMARSHHEARAARRVGEVFGRRPGALLRFGSVSLLSLVSADPAQALAFADTELGALGGDSDAVRRLRATVRVHLEERLSPSRTARRLGIHENTVAYRVKRAEELLGRPLDERRLELEIALRLGDGLDGLRAEGVAPGPARGER